MSFFSIQSSGSKSRTSPAILVGKSDASKRVIGPIPERPGYYSEASQAKRQAVNQWIRTSRAFDGVIDFEAALRDPKDPSRMLPAYDSGDHLDPNDAGYKAMADAIDLAIFSAPG